MENVDPTTDAHVAPEPACADFEERGSDTAIAALYGALAKARTKAVVKFGDRAAELVADPEGVEMASSTTSAAWKARRFTEAAEAGGGGGRVADLCCGIGGDAIIGGDPVDVAGADLAGRRVALLVGIDAIARISEPQAAVGFLDDVVG